MSSANYNGRQPNNTAYIKNFVYGSPTNLWKTFQYVKSDGTIASVLAPNSTNYQSLYVPGDLFVDGNIINPSDRSLKKNIKTIDKKTTDKIMRLKPSSYVFKDDVNNRTHYGFIAQDLEEIYPELIELKPDKNQSNIKAINYLEIIPLLVDKIQQMQQEIDELKEIVNK